MLIRICTFFFSLTILFASCKIDLDDEPIEGNSTTPYILIIPGGLPPMQIPADNPMTVEGITLGKKLFYDKILSGDNTQSCGDCHKQSYAFTDSTNQFSIGIDGLPGTRNAMPLFNLGWSKSFFWDGGAPNIESQVIGPITNPVEMHQDLEHALVELKEHPDYPYLFYQAFGTDSISIPLLMKAIAQFERTIISGNSRYDKYVRNEPGGFLSAQELRGLDLFVVFDKGDCNHCHTAGSTFTDFDFRNTGLDSISIDAGRYLITLDENDRGKFKTPTLRNIELTAPYMHDGRFTTLEQVLEFYNSGFYYPPNLDINLALAEKGRLTEQDKQDIIAFLKTLTDYEFLSNPAFAEN